MNYENKKIDLLKKLGQFGIISITEKISALGGVLSIRGSAWTVNIVIIGGRECIGVVADEDDLQAAIQAALIP